MEKVSLREFARRVGVSEGSVRKAIETGKIAGRSVTKNTRNGRPEILFEKALKDWELFGGGLKKLPKESDEQKEQQPLPQQTGDKISLAEAKRQAAIYDAKRKGLELAELQKVLVPRSKVYEELFAFGQEIKTHIQSVPDKYIDLILAAPNRGEAYKILATAINEALETLSRANELKF